MYKLKNLISLILVFVICLSFAVPTGATELTDANGTAETPVVLTTEAATFKVTVPTSLPISVAADGMVSVAEKATITNLSAGAVKVTNVAINATNDWTLVDHQIDLDEFKVNDKKIGLQLNSAAEMTNADGVFTFDAAQWTRLDATGGTADKYDFTYDAVVAPQSNAIDGATVANVVFTIEWDKTDVVPVVMHTISIIPTCCYDSNVSTIENISNGIEMASLVGTQVSVLYDDLTVVVEDNPYAEHPAIILNRYGVDGDHAYYLYEDENLTQRINDNYVIDSDKTFYLGYACYDCGTESYFNNECDAHMGDPWVMVNVYKGDEIVDYASGIAGEHWNTLSWSLDYETDVNGLYTTIDGVRYYVYQDETLNEKLVDYVLHEGSFNYYLGAA